jgi:hypothetical protein
MRSLDQKAKIIDNILGIPETIVRRKLCYVEKGFGLVVENLAARFRLLLVWGLRMFSIK